MENGRGDHPPTRMRRRQHRWVIACHMVQCKAGRGPRGMGASWHHDDTIAAWYTASSTVVARLARGCRTAGAARCHRMHR